MIDHIARGRAWIFHAYRLLIAHTLGAPFVGGEGRPRRAVYFHALDSATGRRYAAPQPVFAGYKL